MSRHKPITIILDELIHAVEDHCNYTCYYLDRETGEIIFQSEHYYADNADDNSAVMDMDSNTEKQERFIPIAPLETGRGIELMKKFIDSLPEGADRQDLSGALSKRKPFRHFKDALHNYPDIESSWHGFLAGDMKIITEEWLQYYAINYELV